MVSQGQPLEGGHMVIRCRFLLQVEVRYMDVRIKFSWDSDRSA